MRALSMFRFGSGSIESGLYFDFKIIKRGNLLSKEKWRWARGFSL
jgi:hypothetical protein